MALNTDINDIRRQQRRIRALKKLGIILLVAAAAVFIYANRSRWFPNLEGIGTKYEDALGESGSFPISISSGAEYQIGVCGESLVVLSKTGFKIYSSDGKMTANFQHAYTTPVMYTSEKRILVYDMGGVKFRVDSKNKSNYEKTLDDNILLARISDEGYAAVVTTNPMYVCMLYVFDDNGKTVYTRGCTERITDIFFAENSDACYAVSANAANGQLVSYISYFDFSLSEDTSSESQDGTSDSQKDNHYGSTLNTLAVKTMFFDDGGYLMVGDTLAAYYSASGEAENIYAYSDRLVDCKISDDGKAALLFENEDMRCCDLILLERNKGQSAAITLPAHTTQMALSGNEVYVCTENSVNAYNFDGTLSKSIASSEKYNGISIIGDYIYLLGYGQIDRVDSAMLTGSAQTEEN